MKYITVKLTEDQVKELCDRLNDRIFAASQVLTPSYRQEFLSQYNDEKYAQIIEERQAEIAFLTRTRHTLAKAKS